MINGFGVVAKFSLIDAVNQHQRTPKTITSVPARLLTKFLKKIVASVEISRNL